MALLTNPAAVTAAAVAVLFAAAAVLIFRENKRQRAARRKKWKAAWGKAASMKAPSSEYMRRVGAYSASLEGGIDEITAGDLDIASIFARMDSAVSGPGEEYLLACLTHPLLDTDKLAERKAVMDAIASDEERRLALKEALAGVGKLKRSSFFAAIERAKELETIGAGKYAAMSLLTVAAFVMLFFFPTPAVLALIVLFSANAFAHIRIKPRTEKGIESFTAIVRMVKAEKKLSECSFAEADSIFKKIHKAAEDLSAFSFGSSLVTSGGSVDTGLMGAVIEYAKVLFNLDLIQYDRMAGAVKDRGEALLDLFEGIGGLDALTAAAGFRESLPVACEADLKSDGRALMEASCVCHPLLKDPVGNDVSLEGGMLLTGSNASGKSTFLKAAAIAAVLAQSFKFAPAKSYAAPPFRIFTSMALSDSLQNGESYYIVEIRSLKRILDAASTEGAPALCVIDEVLRGTNTIERIASSAAILGELSKKNVLLFAATHDIELTSLLKGKLVMKHFSENVNGSDVAFDYVLKDGPSDTQNAIRLLKGAGYPDSIVEEASERAEGFRASGTWEKDPKK